MVFISLLSSSNCIKKPSIDLLYVVLFEMIRNAKKYMQSAEMYRALHLISEDTLIGHVL